MSVGRCMWAAVREAGVGGVAGRWKGEEERGREREKTREGEGRRGRMREGKGRRRRMREGERRRGRMREG